MERKHQVFVSSTYKDLIEERQHVIHALLELECIPAGMELFPATDEDSWTLIKEIIDDSDYYVLIVAGKYGSTNSEGLSYTEMEFDYAITINKPIICFLHQSPEELLTIKTERSESLQEKLIAFKIKIQLKHCKFWSSSEDLGGKVSRSMIQLKKKHPSDGWIPGKYAADEKLFRTIDELRTKIEVLEKEKTETVNNLSIDTSLLAQGSDMIPMKFNLKNNEGKIVEMIIPVTWDKIFSYTGRAMYGECSDIEFRQKIQLASWHSLTDDITKSNSYTLMNIRHVYFDVIKVQLQALGLIVKGKKKRAVSDQNTYWDLTPYGEKYLLKIAAIKKEII